MTADSIHYALFHRPAIVSAVIDSAALIGVLDRQE
jgi:hypothetical protein